MPDHPPQWTDFLSCSRCKKEFSLQVNRLPVTLLCGHSVCKECVANVRTEGCKYDQNTVTPDLPLLPVNFTILKIIAYQTENDVPVDGVRPSDPRQLVVYLGESYLSYTTAIQLLESLSVHLQDIKNGLLPHKSDLTKPMLRKLVALVQCQICFEDGRLRALRACRALGERVATELILAHQNPSKLSGNLWTAVRARGCQFLGPAMQEEALKLILLALEDGSELSRKVLVMFVVQKLQQQFSQASKTSIGHVVQLLYRASCFVVKKRDGDSSLMKLKEVYRTYPALRREHDTQVVQIAREAGLRIAPDQWSALLYGDQGHKSHMQSIIDRLQSGESLMRCIQDLENALEKSNSPQKLQGLVPHFKVLAEISAESATPPQDTQKNDWGFLIRCLKSVKVIIEELIVFSKNHTHEFFTDEEAMAQTAKFKTSLCRDIKSKGTCPRGSSCTFAHTERELQHYRNKRKKASLGLVGSREKSQEPKSPLPAVEDGVAEATRGNENCDERVFSSAFAPSAQRPESNHGGHSPYYHPPYPPIHHGSFHAPPEIPINQTPGGVPPTPQYPPPFRPPFYPYEAYHTRLPYGPPQQNHMAVMPNIGTPPQGLYLEPQGGNRMSVKTADQNVPQFTVTLSFQSKPNDLSMNSSQHQSPRRPPLPTNEGINFAVPARSLLHHDSLGRNNAALPMAENERRHRAPSSVMLNSREEFYSLRPQVGSPSNHVGNAPHPNFGIMLPQEPVYHRVNTPVFQSPAPLAPNNDPRVAVVAPQPIMQPQTPTPTHLYDPNTNMVFPNAHVDQGARNPMVISPSPVPANQPVYVPVLPVTQYQVMNPMRQQMHQQASTTSSEPAIPKTIDEATVEQLERRKGEILSRLIQNQRKEETTFPCSIAAYDVWSCSGYTSLLKVATTATLVPENLQTEDYATNVVDVIAEIDTGTQQVTVRDTDHLNPSHARNERTLDDAKMHRLLVERHDDMNNAEFLSEPTQPLRALIHYSSGPQEEEDDEIIPFSDRPTVSKYGPIARSVRTRPSNTDLVQVNANAEVNTNAVQAMSESLKQKRTEVPSTQNLYSSFESLNSVSYFPASFPRSRESLSTQNARNHPSIPASAGMATHKKISLTQAASNSKLLHREQAALQQNHSQSGTEDLRLTTELQQIELGIQQKKQQQNQ